MGHRVGNRAAPLFQGVRRDQRCGCTPSAVAVRGHCSAFAGGHARLAQGSAGPASSLGVPYTAPRCGSGCNKEERSATTALRTLQPPLATSGGSERSGRPELTTGDPAIALRGGGAHPQTLVGPGGRPASTPSWVLRSCATGRVRSTITVAAAGVPVAGPALRVLFSPVPEPVFGRPQHSAGRTARPWPTSGDHAAVRQQRAAQRRCWRRPARAVRGRAARRAASPALQARSVYLADPVTGRRYVANSGCDADRRRIPCIPGQHLGTCLSILQNRCRSPGGGPPPAPWPLTRLLL